MPTGSIHRDTYASLFVDAKRLSNALLAHGIGRGDRVATLAMNGVEHMAAWYAISGIGAVCHTLNPRLFDEQLIYIVNHANDRIILADNCFGPDPGTHSAALPQSGARDLSDVLFHLGRSRPFQPSH